MSPDEYEAKRADIAALTQALNVCVDRYNEKVAEVREELNILYDEMAAASRILTATGVTINGRYGDHGAALRHLFPTLDGESPLQMHEAVYPYVELRVTMGAPDVD